MTTINEASLSRVWQHMNSDRPVGLLTAFRSENTRDENLRLNKMLAADIRKLGYGYFFVDGHWIENEGTPQEILVDEDTLFVIGDPKNDQAIVKQLTTLAKKYKQEGVLIKNSAGSRVYDANGNIIVSFKEFKPGGMADIYTSIRKNKKSNTFVFESERDDKSWLSRLIDKNT